MGKEKTKIREQGKENECQVNSSSKCTTSSLTEDPMRCLVVETLSGAIIKFIDDKSNFFFGDIIQNNSFGEILS